MDNAPKQEGPISALLACLEKEQDGLCGAIDHLTERIAPILKPEQGTAAMDEDKAERPPESPLEQILRRIICYTQNLHVTCDKIANRVAF